MTKEKKKRVMYALASAVVLLVFLFIDQFTKAIVDKFDIEQSTYFLGLIRIYNTRNYGIAFSWLSNSPVMMYVVTALTVVLIIGIVALFFTLFKGNYPAQICLAIIEAGAIGNLIDRLCLGYVRDFLDISPLHFGVCNPADFCITLGAVALLFVILFIGRSAIFPMTKKWKEEARILYEKKNAKKNGALAAASPKRDEPVTEELVYMRSEEEPAAEREEEEISSEEDKREKRG